MSGTMLRQLVKVLPGVEWVVRDTLHRIAYVAERGKAVGQGFALSADWHRALPIFGGLPALAPSTARRRLALVKAAGWLETDGGMARVKLPGMEAIWNGARAVRRAASHVLKLLSSSVATFGQGLDALRQYSADLATGAGLAGAHDCGASPCFLIEDDASSADGGHDTGYAGVSCSTSGASSEASRGGDFGYSVGPERADGWQERGQSYVEALFPALRYQG